MYVNPKVVKSSYIGKYFKDIFEEKSLSVTEVAEKMGTSQPNLSNALNGKKVFSDKFFSKLGKTIGLKESELKKVFKEAAVQEFMYEFGDMIPSNKEMSLEEGLQWLQEKAGLSNEQVKAIKAIIAFQKKNS